MLDWQFANRRPAHWLQGQGRAQRLTDSSFDLLLFSEVCWSQSLGNASEIRLPIFPGHLEDGLNFVCSDLHPGKPHNSVCRRAFGSHKVMIRRGRIALLSKVEIFLTLMHSPPTRLGDPLSRSRKIRLPRRLSSLRTNHSPSDRLAVLGRVD